MHAATLLLALVATVVAVPSPIAPATGSNDLDSRALYSSLTSRGRGPVTLKLSRQEPSATVSRRDLLQNELDHAARKYLPFLSAEKRAAAENHLAKRTVPLTNWARDLQYNVAIEIGTPRQTFNVVCDTGSPDLWVMAASCQSEACSDMTTFDPSASSSYANVNQTLYIGYGSGNVSGQYGKDIVALDSSTYFPQEFGLGIDVSVPNFSKRNTQGILGLSWPVAGHPDPFWYNLFQDGNFDENVFGIYLKRSSLSASSNSSDANGGEITIGGTDSAVYTGDFNTIPLQNVNETFWNIPLDSVSINGAAISMNGSKSMIDSGTSLIYTSQSNADEFYSHINGSTIQDNAFVFPCNSTHAASFTFGGVEYPVFPYDMTPLVNGDLCYGAVQVTALPFDTQWVFGDAFMKNVYTKFVMNPPAVALAKLADDANIKVNNARCGRPLTR